MPPAVNQEINVNINALVKRIQDVKDLVAAIKSLRGQSGPVVIDEKISQNARASIGDVDQLTAAVDKLGEKIDQIDERRFSRLSVAISLLSAAYTAVSGVPQFFDGLDKLKQVGVQAPGIAGGFSRIATGARELVQVTRQKVGDGLTKVKDGVAGLVDKIPAVVRSGGAAAGTIGTIGVAGAGAAVGLGALAITLGAVVAVIVALLAQVALVGWFFSLAKSAADAGSEIHDASQEFAVSAETLSALKVATRTTSTTFEEATVGVGRFNKLIGEAADGSKEATAKLKQLGLEPQEALKNNEAALAKVFKRIHELPTPLEKSIAAQRAFGKSGAALVPVIDSVKGSLEGAKQKAAEFGELLNDKAEKEADEFGDQLEGLGIRTTGLANSIGRTLIPEILKLLRILANEFPKAGGIFNLVLRAIAFNVRTLTNGIIVLIAAAKTLKDVPAAIAAGIALKDPGIGATILGSSFQTNLRELNSVANTPAPDLDQKGPSLVFGSPSTKTKKDATPADTFDSRLALARAAADQVFNLEKDLLDRLQILNDQALEDKTTSLEEYYATAETLRLREIDNEIAHLRRLNAIALEARDEELKKINANKEQKTEAQQIADRTNARNKFFAETADNSTRILILEKDRAEVANEIARTHGEANEALQQEVDSASELLDTLNGKTRVYADLVRRLVDLREKLIKLGGRTEDDPFIRAIDEAVDHAGRLDQIRNVLERLAIPQQQSHLETLEVETRLHQKLITRKEAHQQINAIQKKYLELQLLELNHALTLAKTEKDRLDIKLQIAEAENQLAQIQDEVDQTARSINDSLRGGLEDFFGSLADGSKNIKEAFADLGSFILQMFARLAAAKLVQSIFGDLLGDEEGAGGIGGFLSGLFGGQKAAGDVVNARPGGRLIQVAEAGFDELVVSTDPRYQVRTSALLGNFIRRTGILPDGFGDRFAAGGFARAIASSFTTSIPRLAAGAFVPAEIPALAGGAPSEFNLSEKHIHVWDPRHLDEHNRSPAGQRTFIHNVASNKTLIMRMLGIK